MAGGYLRVKNWEKHQHYKDRSPPWIKLHRSLLDDYEFGSLQDEPKLNLLLIWLLAGSNNGRVPNDQEFLRKKLGVANPVNLDALISAGFLIPEQDASRGASKTLARRKQNAPLEEERRGEKKPCPNAEAFERFWAAYPRRQKKGDARKAFAAIKPDAELLAAMCTAIDVAKLSMQWRKDGGQFIPLPATWLRAEGWLDEQQPARPSAGEQFAQSVGPDGAKRVAI